jgi:hypothetical protein
LTNSRALGSLGKAVSLKKASFWAAFLGVLIFTSIFLFRVKDEMVDFEVNYKAGERIKWGETIYQTEDGHYQFKYPPFSALLYLPLSYLPLDAAKFIWYSVILLSTGLLFFASHKLLTTKKKGEWIIPVLTFIILARFFLRELQLGQINSLITFLLISIVWLIISDENLSSTWKKRGAGFLWGLSTVLKPYALIFLPYFLIKRKWQTLCSGALFLGLAFIAPSLFYGFKGNLYVHKEWLSSLSSSTPLLFDSQDNISIIAFFMKRTEKLEVSVLLYGAVLIILAFFLLFIVLKGSKMKNALLLDSSILFICIPLISPMGWDYTLLSSALGVMIILRSFFNFPKFWRGILIINFFIIVFSLYDILGRRLYASFMSLSIITINFLILIVCLSYLRLKRYK